MESNNNDDGMELLLRFALGPLEVGNCGSQDFFNNVKKYLEGETGRRESVREEISKELKTAWPNLISIAERTKRDPLDLETVSAYVYQEHNLNVMSSCAVKVGQVGFIDNKKRVARVLEKESVVEIRFLSSFKNKFKAGEYVYYHYHWMLDVKK